MLNTHKKKIAFSALCMGFFMVILDVTIVNVALPSIANYFRTSLSNLQWVVDGYTLTFAGLLLLVGSLTDSIGAKRIFQAGLIAFSLTSLGCAISPSIGALIFFRLLQGMSGALLLPPSLALISSIYPEVKEKARAIGVWAALGGVACASGPFLGGIITHLVSWRGVFLVNIVIGFISFCLASRYIDAPKYIIDKIKFDFLGQAIGFITILALAYGLIEASAYGWSSPIIIMCFVVSVIGLVLFLVTETYTRQPMVPLSLFNNKTTSTALFVAMILNLSFYGALFMMPFYFEKIRHYTVLMTGFALLPLPALAVVGSYFGGKCTAEFGPARVIFFGLFFSALGFLALLTLRTTTPDYVWVAIPFFVIGLGISFTTSAMTLAAIQSAEEKRKGIVSAVLNTVNQLGSLIGVATFGTIILTAHTLLSGMHIVFLIVGILFLFTAFLALYFMRNVKCD